MSLLPAEASFHERVQDLFAAFRGRGVMLSALDVELLDQWASSGAPFEVVARGIRLAAEGALYDAPEDDRGLRSLIACKRKVEAELKKYISASAGRSAPAAPAAPKKAVPLHLKRHKKLKAALKRSAKVNPELTAGVARLLAGLQPPEDFEGAQAQEDLAHAVLVHALPFTQRLELLHQARKFVQKSAPMSARARHESLRLHRAALLRRALALPAFW
jgi:hypothetical protein